MSKTLLVSMKIALDLGVKIVNYIQGKVLNNRLFKACCSDLDDDDASVLLFHTDIRWLSRDQR